MKKSRVIIGVAMAAALALGASACSQGGSGGSGDSGDSGGSKSLGSATILGNWFAQAEMGGYIAADANGIAKKLGVDLTYKQGGPGIQTIPQVAAGKAEFGVGNADEVLVAVNNGVPIVAIAAGPQENLQCLAYHKSSGIKDFSDLNGHTVSRVPSPYWDYIKKHYDLTSVKEINIGSLASFKKDDNLVQQCFITAEPYTIKKMGMTDIGYLRVKDSGYNAYQDLLFTTKQVIDQKPDLVKAVVKAADEGWTTMLKDPAKTKAFVAKVNPDADPGVFDFAVDLMKKDNLIGDDPGSMSDARWKQLRDQLADIGMLKSDFDYTKAFTLKFVGGE